MTTKMIFQVSKVGFPIRKSPDQSLFATPRGLSQRITSFIACACQGIHRTPLRHLIVLIANTHLELEWAWQKDQLLETYPKVAVRQTCHVQRLSGLTAVNRSRTEPGYIFSSQFHTEQAERTKRAANLFFPANDFPKVGGAGRDRTDDILLAKQALSQLSYGPKLLELVGLGGLEPPTSRLSSARSNQLSYKP
jgi:hypothetical protein